LIKKVTLCEFESFASFWFWIEPCIDLIKKPCFLWRSSTKLNIFLGLGISLVSISVYFHHSSSFYFHILSNIHKITKLKLQPFRPSSPSDYHFSLTFINGIILTQFIIFPQKLRVWFVYHKNKSFFHFVWRPQKSDEHSSVINNGKRNSEVIMFTLFSVLCLILINEL